MNKQTNDHHTHYPQFTYTNLVVSVSIVVGLILVSVSPPTSASWFDKLKDIKENYSKPETKDNSADVSAGLKEALKVGSQKSIQTLSRPNGFFKDPKVHIPLPPQLDKLADLMERLGQKKQVSEFVKTLNRAAEKSVSVSGEIFLDAIRQMTIVDAINIYRGNDDEATRYFRRTAGPSLFKAIRPIVSDSTEKVGVTHQYKKLRAGGGNLGKLLIKSSPDLDNYITTKTIDGLFVKIAEQEAEIRHNPKARTTDLLKKVFSSK